MLYSYFIFPSFAGITVKTQCNALGMVMEGSEVTIQWGSKYKLGVCNYDLWVICLYCFYMNT